MELTVTRVFRVSESLRLSGSFGSRETRVDKVSSNSRGYGLLGFRAPP